MKIKLKSSINNKKNIIIISVIVFCSLFLMVYLIVPYFSIKSEGLTLIDVPNFKVGEPIPVDIGEISLAKTKTKELFIDTTTLNMKVKDLETGEKWQTLYLNNEGNEIEKSPLIIKFLGKDSQIYKWTSYKNCISNQSYELNKIKNGVSINFNFNESESVRLDEYMPKKISIERYEKVFLEKIDQILKEKKITKEEADKFKSTLSLVYQKDEENDCYFNKFRGVPPVTAIHILIDLAKKIDYTREMLIKDNEQFDIQVEIEEPANFTVVMNVMLEQDDLIVEIPTDQIKNNNENYVLQNIQVLPNFGTITSQDEVTDGYILVPDGSGALFKLNNYNGVISEYTRPLYNNTYYDDLYEMNPFKETMTMPIFGMLYEKNNRNQGFMGIMESGSLTSSINVRLGTKTPDEGGNIFNKVFASLDTMQFSRVKVFGPYSDKNARYLSTTNLMTFNYRIRYKFFTKDASYFNMAKVLQNYLIEKYAISKNFSEKNKVFLNVIGGLSTKDRVLGIPYDKTISMTTYDELDIILDKLSINDLVINYSGGFNKGQNSSLLNKPKLVHKNGTQAELNTLMNKIHQSNGEFFMQGDLLKIYQKGNGFKESIHSVYGYGGKPLKIYDYNLASKRFMKDSKFYYLLNPRYLSSVVSNFIKETNYIKNIYLGDMASASLYYVDYNQKHLTDPYQSDNIIEKNLKAFKAKKTLALENPKLEKMHYGKYAVNISRQSSEFSTMYMTIPFRQLVYNGLTEYTTLDINMSSKRKDYFLLQAFELGSIPKFSISSKSADLLKNTYFTDYYRIQFDYLEKDFNDFYEEYKKGMDEINCKEIINHELLGKNIFLTTYKNGVRVLTNYNLYEVNVDDKKLSPLGYLIVKD